MSGSKRSMEPNTIEYDIPRKGLPEKIKTLKIVNNKNNNFIDDLIKKKKLVPSPSHYTVKEVTLNPKNPITSKGRRQSIVDEAEKHSKQVPAPDKYIISDRLTKKRTTLGISPRAPSTGFISEA